MYFCKNLIGRRHNRRGGKSGGHRQTTEDTVTVDENNPVMQMFLGYREELDGRHDKHERLVKISRDITIESKRTIFLLQRHKR